MLRILMAVLFTLTVRPLAAQQDGNVQGYRYEEPDVIRDSVADVMSRPEFSRLRVEPADSEEASESPRWLSRLLEWLAQFFDSSETQSPSRPVSWTGIELVLYLMAALVVIAVIAFIFKSVVSARREKKLKSIEEEAHVFRAGKAPGEDDPQSYWERAQILGDEKEFKRAIRELLLGAMSSLERRGVIRHRRGLTNRDYLRVARGAARDSLGTIVRNFDYVYFGRREATADGFEDCCREFQKGFLGSSR
jgi:hypothetical protein